MSYQTDPQSPSSVDMFPEASNVALTDILYLVQPLQANRDRHIKLAQLAAAIASAAETGKVYASADAVGDQVATAPGYLIDQLNQATNPSSAFGDIAATVVVTQGGHKVRLNILDGAVTEGKIANDSVTSHKIAARAVEMGAIAVGAVTEDTIAVGAVTDGKIADGAVSLIKLSAAAKLQWRNCFSFSSSVLTPSGITSAYVACPRTLIEGFSLRIVVRSDTWSSSLQVVSIVIGGQTFTNLTSGWTYSDECYILDNVPITSQMCVDFIDISINTANFATGQLVMTVQQYA